MMTFADRYAPAILAGVLLALILIIFLVSSLRAHRHHTTPPRATWPTLLMIASTWILMFLDVRFRLDRGDAGAFFEDAVVALGTFFVVSIVVAVPLTYLHGRSMPVMTEAEREAWLDQRMGDWHALAKFVVASHAVILTHGAIILVAFLAIILIWALAR